MHAAIFNKYSCQYLQSWSSFTEYVFVTNKPGTPAPQCMNRQQSTTRLRPRGNNRSNPYEQGCAWCRNERTTAVTSLSRDAIMQITMATITVWISGNNVTRDYRKSASLVSSLALESTHSGIFQLILRPSSYISMILGTIWG